MQMSEKEELKKDLVELADKLKHEVQSGETCISSDLENVDKDWRLLDGELRGAIEFLELLLAEIKSKDLDKKLVEVEIEIDEVEDELERSSFEDKLTTVDDVDGALAILKVFLSCFSYMP